MEALNPSLCEIKHIAVSPKQRGDGVGRAMIDFIIDTYSSCTIIAETDKDAVNFYQTLGFKITSLGETYPGVERFQCLLDSHGKESTKPVE